jgi:hypothetical protein
MMEAPRWRAVERRGQIIRSDGSRIVIIPDNFFLKGEQIIIRREKDGAITIYPAKADVRKAMFERFDPFSDWEMEE